MQKKWFISAFPEIEKISQTLVPKLWQKWWKIEHLMKRFIGSAKPHSSVFHFFARCYDAEEVIHKRISWNWEDISNSGPKSLPKMMKNWTFNEMVHRIHKTSQSRFSLFCKILRCWKRDSSAHFLKSRKYLKRWPKIRQQLWKIQALMQRSIGSPKPHRSVFRFLQDITMLRKWFISAFPEIEKISQTLVPKLWQKL